MCITRITYFINSGNDLEMALLLGAMVDMSLMFVRGGDATEMRNMTWFGAGQEPPSYKVDGLR